MNTEMQAIEHVRIFPLDVSPLIAPDCSPLSETGPDGVARFPLQESLPAVAFADYYQAQAIRLEPRRSYDVILARSAFQVFSCRTEDGGGLQGVALAMTKGGACELPALVDRDKLRPGVDPETALHADRSAESGESVITDLSVGEYRLFVEPPPGYVMTHVTLRPGMKIWVPSAPVELTFAELRGCVLGCEDDEVVLAKVTRTPGVTALSASSGPACVNARRNLQERFKGCYVYVGAPEHGWNDAFEVHVTPFLRKRGWVDAVTLSAVPLSQLTATRVAAADLPSADVDMTGSLRIELASPDGRLVELPRPELSFRIAAGPNRNDDVLATVDGGAAVVLPAGRHFIVPLTPFLGWALDPLPVDVAQGKEATIARVVAKQNLFEVSVNANMRRHGDGAGKEGADYRQPAFLLLSGTCGSDRVGGMSFAPQACRGMLLHEGEWRLRFYCDGCETRELVYCVAPRDGQTMTVDFALRPL